MLINCRCHRQIIGMFTEKCIYRITEPDEDKLILINYRIEWDTTWEYFNSILEILEAHPDCTIYTKELTEEELSLAKEWRK